MALTANEVLNSKEFAEFYSAVEEYLFLIENIQIMEAGLLLPKIQSGLLKIYSSARNLPVIELKNINDSPDLLDSAQLQSIKSKLAERLPYQYYWDVLDIGIDTPGEIGCGDINDDLLDTYIDLKRATLIFELGDEESIENALWRFHFDFNNHWGNHCINAIRAMHYAEKGKAD